jgi:hypothetical protein
VQFESNVLNEDYIWKADTNLELNDKKHLQTSQATSNKHKNKKN